MDISNQKKEIKIDISQVTDHSSSSSRQPPYEVFLSFRGSEMHREFADFLYTMLTDVGICVFRDDKELESGKEIHPQLMGAILQSKISIPVISKEFASSKSCLMELEQMVECMKKNHTIIPVFYYVEPSDVRNCRGPFERAFDERQQHAFRRIADLKGHHLTESDKYDSEVIKQIVREVEQMLKKRDLIVPKQLVVVDPHVQEIMAKLKVDHSNKKAVKIGDTCEKVLIYGIPGVGKTVLAKYVYNQLHHLFDACSFLEKIQEEIRDHGIVSVQNRLIYHLHKETSLKFDLSDHALRHIQDRFHAMKVLVLLDDVKDHEQLSALVGELDWFGPGSTVIATSQRDDVLKKVEGAETFGLRMMQQDKALQLFSRHAFEKDSPPKEFEEVSTNIVAATDGLPLALEMVGKSLFQNKKKVWTETLTALKEAPDKSAQEAFFKSYVALDEEVQQIFLDIACFFNGKDKRIPYYMWDDRMYSPSRSILTLHAKSLVEIGEDKKICMRGILKTFGQEIVKNESKKEPCKRSRLCNHKEALDVLKGGKGTVYVEALRLEFGDVTEGNICFGCDHFKGLQNLRFLKLDWADIRGNFRDRLSNLRWLDWQGCTKIFDSQSLNLNVQNLLILDLSGSQVDTHWTGWMVLVEARKLKVLKLTGCVQLTATPEFPPSMELERLILEGCSNLAVIHPSVSNLEKLVSLNMKQCNRLSELPDLGPMRALEELLIDGTSISRIDFQEGSMKTLSLKSCQGLTYLPEEIGKFRFLKFLDLSDTMIRELPPIEEWEAMKVLRMRGTFIEEFPAAILNLEKLEEIDFSLCGSLEGRIPEGIGRLTSLAILNLSDTRISGLPPSISCLPRLQKLDISRCDHLQSLPEFPSSLIIVR